MVYRATDDRLFIYKLGSSPEFADLSEYMSQYTLQAAVNLDRRQRFGKEFPLLTPVGLNVNFQTGGIIYDVDDSDILRSEGNDFIFMVASPENGFMGPIGQARSADGVFVTDNGIVTIQGSGDGVHNEFLQRPKYGKLLPSQWNTDRASSVAGYGNPRAGQQVVIALVKRGTVSSIEVRYTISNRPYSYRKTGISDEGIWIGQLKNSSNNLVPGQAGNWRVNVTGGSFTLYIGLINRVG